MNKENQHKETLPYGVVSSEGINLYNGDCLEVMDYLISQNIIVDAIITDPPYGTTACKWDSIIPFDEMWKRLNKLIKPNGAIVLFGSEPFSSALRMSNIKNYKYDWVWNKPTATGHLNAKKQPMRAYENISVFYTKQTTYNFQKTQGHERKVSSAVSRGKSIERAKGKSKVYGDEIVEKVTDYDSTERYPRNIITFSTDKQKSKLHPTQKPVALMKYLIKTYTNENETVLDFTMGSGTTGVACKNTNRNFIGIELDENYFKIAKERNDMTEKEQEKSVHSMLDGAEIYSRDFFVEHGKRGGKIGGLKSASVSEEERSKRAKNGWATRRKLAKE